MRKMKWLALLLVAVMALAATGCGGGASTPPAEEPDSGTDAPAEPPAEPAKVAILIPSSPTDGGWGQVGADGLRYVAEGLGIEPVIVEAGTADLMREEAEALAAEGYDVIFGHGGQYASPFGEISGDYPDTLFVTAGGSVVTDNQMPLEFVLERMTYIQGVMAAELTETNKLGMVIGGEFPAYTKTSRAFELGAKSVNPDIEVLLGVTQDSSDMNEGYELSLSQVQAGADVLFTNANQATQGSVAAARETETWIFAAVRDISAEAPDQAVSTAAQDFGPAMLATAQSWIDGTLEGGSAIIIDDKSGGIFWVWNDNVKDKLPAEVVGLYEELLPKVMSGEINVPRENEGW